jgi:hypothetical protein
MKALEGNQVKIQPETSESYGAITYKPNEERNYRAVLNKYALLH